MLWLLPNDERAQKLATAVKQSDKLTTTLYRYATPETLVNVLAGGAA